MKYKAWVCRDRQLGRKGNGCNMRILKEDDLLMEICSQMEWKRFGEKLFERSVERVVISGDGMEVVTRGGE